MSIPRLIRGHASAALTLFSLVISACLPAWPDEPTHASLKLALLSQPGPTAALVTLRQIASEVSARGQSRLTIYLWQANFPNVKEYEAERAAGSSDAQLWPVTREDLRGLERVRGEAKAGRVISIVAIYPADDQRQRARVYDYIKSMMKAVESDIPVYVVAMQGQDPAVYQGLLDSIRARAGKDAPLPFLVRFDATTLAVTEASARDREPVRADDWVRRLDLPADRPSFSGKNGEDFPRDCGSSWLRWQIRRVWRSGLLLPSHATRDTPFTDADFSPLDVITQRDFLAAFQQIDHPSAAPSLLNEGDPAASLTRECAYAATVRYLYGDHPSLAEAPVPASPYTTWPQAFRLVPGSAFVTPARRDYLTMALSKGLVYYQPCLLPNDSIRREEAAWLLAHALAGHGTDWATSGLLVDTTDVPLDPDPAAGRADIYYDRQEGSGHRAVHLYPPMVQDDGLPAPALGYPPVLYVKRSELGLKERQLNARVGLKRTIVTAVDTLGVGTLYTGTAPTGAVLAHSVLISEEAAQALLEENQNSGLLDDWRVAIVYGVGARLVRPSDGVLTKGATLEIYFSRPMAKETLTSDNIWMEAVGEGASGTRRVGVTVEPQSTNVFDRTPRKVIITPAELRPGGEYYVVLGADLKSAEGEPIDLPLAEKLPEGVARRWQVRVDPTVRFYLRLVGVQRGSAVELDGKPLSVSGEESPIELTGIAEASLPLKVTLDGQLIYDGAVTVPLEEGSTVGVEVKQPTPARVVIAKVEPESRLIRPGEPIALTLQVESTGYPPQPITRHAPVTVTITGEGFTPRRHSLVLPGPTTVTLTAKGPGPVHIEISAKTADGADVGVGEPVELICTTADPKAPPAQAVETLRARDLPPPGRGEPVIPAKLRWRRWFATSLGHTVEVRVLGRRGEGVELLAPCSTVPRGMQFQRQPDGTINLPASLRTDMIVNYEYRRGRCGLVVTGALPAELQRPAHAQLEEVLAKLGYDCISEDELYAALPWQADLTSAQAAGQVRLAKEKLSLDDIFVINLISGRGGRYTMVWYVWSQEHDSGNEPWSMKDAKKSLRSFRLGRPPEVLPGSMSEVLSTYLSDWLWLVGLEFADG